MGSIKGRSCRIMWSQRDPSLRKSGAGNVYVKNLDLSIDNKALYDTFSLFGNILSCKVASDPEGKSRGYGFVHYETEEAAKQAIERVNGMQIGEKTVIVTGFLKRNDREPVNVTNYTNLYIKNMPSDWDEEKVNEVFGAYGEITSTCVMENAGRKFAFVNFAESENALKCVEEMHEKDLRTEEEKKASEGEEKEGDESGKLYVQRAMTKYERQNQYKAQTQDSKGADPGGVNLYVKNLEDTTDDEALKALFEPFGTVTSAKSMMDDKGKCKGFGFVCFGSPDEATKAVTEMHLKVVNGKPLYVGLAEKRDVRAERLRSRYTVGSGKGGKGGKGGPKGMAMGGGMPQMGGMMPMMGGPQMGMMGKGPMMGGPQMGMKGGPMMGGARPMMPQMMMGNPQQMQMMQKGGPQMMMPQKGNPQMMAMMGKGPMPGAPMPGMMRPMMPQQMQGPPQQMGKPAAPQAQPQAAQGNLNASVLASAPPAVQKQMIGEKLYPAIAKIQPEVAGKVTGMMLEMDNSELLMLLESEQQLKLKVNEAIQVLGIQK